MTEPRESASPQKHDKKDYEDLPPHHPPAEKVSRRLTDSSWHPSDLSPDMRTLGECRHFISASMISI